MVETRTPIRRGDVFWANLDPFVGTEIKKMRPVLVISPDDMNAALTRVIVAPVTSGGDALGCRPELAFAGKAAKILLDQLRCVDKARLRGKLGRIDAGVWHPVLLQMLS